MEVFSHGFPIFHVLSKCPMNFSIHFFKYLWCLKHVSSIFRMFQIIYKSSEDFFTGFQKFSGLSVWIIYLLGNSVGPKKFLDPPILGTLVYNNSPLAWIWIYALSLYMGVPYPQSDRLNYNYLCSYTTSALNAGACHLACHMTMPQCCYLSKGAKRPSHTTNMKHFFGLVQPKFIFGLAQPKFIFGLVNSRHLLA